MLWWAPEWAPSPGAANLLESAQVWGARPGPPELQAGSSWTWRRLRLGPGVLFEPLGIDQKIGENMRQSED